MNRADFNEGKALPKWPEPKEGLGLLVSPHCWVYGILCLAIWAALACIFLGGR